MVDESWFICSHIECGELTMRVWSTMGIRIRGGKSHFDTMKDSIPIHLLVCSYVQFNISKCSNFKIGIIFGKHLFTFAPHFFQSQWIDGRTVLNLLFNIWFNMFAFQFTTCDDVCDFFSTQKKYIYLTQLCPLWHYDWLCLLCTNQVEMFDLFVEKKVLTFFSMCHCCGCRHIPFWVDKKCHQTFWWHSIFNFLIWSTFRHNTIIDLLYGLLMGPSWCD